MTENLLRSLLRRKERDNDFWEDPDALACKYMGLLWLKSQGCNMIFKNIFKEHEDFEAEFNGKQLYFTARCNPKGVLFTLTVSIYSCTTAKCFVR